MNDAENKLTPELVSMAIAGGLLDNSLDALRAVIRSRKSLLSTMAAHNLVAGDRFIVINISPKKWDGIEVTFTGKREGIWLVCHLNDEDTIRLNRIGGHLQIPSMLNTMRVQKFRETHVGPITHKMGE